MNTPLRSGLRAVLFLLAFVVGPVATAEPSAPLSLEAKVDGIWIKVLGREQTQLLGQAATGPCKIPTTAPLRLTGDLNANLTVLDATATFDLVEEPQPTDSGLPPQWKATRIHLLGASFSGSDARWLPAQPDKAVLVCVWQISGHAAQVLAIPLATTTPARAATNQFALDLGDGAATGNPVFLLWENGQALPARRQLGSGEQVALLAALGQDDAAASLLKNSKGIPPAATDQTTLLHFAAQAGASHTVDTLLELGADPKVKDANGNTALHRAAHCGRATTTARLIAAKTPIAAANNSKETPLHLAASSAHAEVCRLLVEAGAPLGSTNKGARTPFACAFAANCTPAVEFLLSRGDKFQPGIYSLERELVNKSAQGQRGLVRLLLTHRANPDEFVGNQTPLIAASRGGHADVVAELLAAKANPNRGNQNRVTPLLAAASRGRAEVVQQLLAAGAKPDAAGPGGNTPLHAACFAGSAASVKALLAAGTAVDAANKIGARPLIFALGSGSLEAVEFLLGAGAKVDPADPFFGAELTTALTMDADSFLAAALRAGMPLDYRTKKGWNVLQLATLAQANRCAALLRAAGAPEPENNEAVAPLRQLDKRPEVTSMASLFDPRDPDETDFKGESVTVEAIVDKDGTTAVARATCQDCRLAQSAVQVVLGTRFSPAIKGGQPVATMVRIPVSFPDRSALTFDFAALHKKPAVTKQVPPLYPFQLKRHGIMGEATVQFIIAADGTVRDIVVISATHEGFASSAVQAVRQWRFTPGEFDGQPVACRMVQAFPFRLN
jgi:TonB family protein